MGGFSTKAPQPDQNRLGAEIDMGHHPYLTALLVHVGLVDADGIGPEPPTLSRSTTPEELMGIPQVLRDGKCLPIDEDLVVVVAATPVVCV